MKQDGRGAMDKKSFNLNGEAIFIGIRETISGDAFPLKSVTVENHPLRGSTGTENTLNNLNLQVPEQYNAHNNGNRFDHSVESEN